MCRRCSEPWDFYEVTHEFEPQEKKDFYSGKGCPCCIGKDIKPDEDRELNFLRSIDEGTDMDPFEFM